MGWFGKKEREDDVLDLTKAYHRNKTRSLAKAHQSEAVNTYEPKEIEVVDETPAAGFLSNLASSNTPRSSESTSDAAEKRKRLAKRLVDMTNKMEDMANEIYQLKQRIDVLERKLGSGY